MSGHPLQPAYHTVELDAASHTTASAFKYHGSVKVLDSVHCGQSSTRFAYTPKQAREKAAALVAAAEDAERMEMAARGVDLTGSEHSAADLRRRCQPLREARAAVAELVAAATVLNARMEDAWNDRTLPAETINAATARRFRAALAAFGERP